MKKITLFLSLTISACLSFKAQQPANPGFENWSTVLNYENPDPYLSTSSWVYSFYPGGNVTKVSPAAHGNYAAQLTTVSTASDTTFGGLFIGTPGANGVNGGLPFTGQPYAVSAYVKYDIQPADTASFILAFKKNGIVIGVTVQQFTGIQNSFQQFVIPTNLPVFPAPDTLVAVITSSNLNYPPIPGSTLTIDSISLYGTTQLFPNYSFENWTPNTSEEPDNWGTINWGDAAGGPVSATKSTSSHTGNFALRLETVKTLWSDSIGLVTNGNIGSNGVTGGLAITANANPAKVTGYYKYIPVGPDTAFAFAYDFLNSSVVDMGIIQLTAQSNYTYFEIPLNYNSLPYADTLNIVFSSSNSFNTSAYKGLGSVLYIDDISVVYNTPLAISNPATGTQHKLYPNPFNDVAILTFSNEAGKSYDLLIYDMMGNVVMKKENIRTNSIMINRENLSEGIYQYRINESKSGTIAAGGKLIID